MAKGLGGQRCLVHEETEQGDRTRLEGALGWGHTSGHTATAHPDTTEVCSTDPLAGAQANHLDAIRLNCHRK